MSKTCKFEACDGNYLARGWCRKHYLRWWRYGDPNAVHKSDGGKGRITPDQAKHYLSMTGRDNEDISASESPTTHDIAWAAGIIEADGCFVSKRNGDLSVHVSQKEPWLVHSLQELFGGRIKDTGADGKYWEWRATGPRGRGVAMTVYQFMSPHEKAKAETALQEGREWKQALERVIEEDHTFTKEELGLS